MRKSKILGAVALVALLAGYGTLDLALGAPAPTIYGDTGVCDPWYPQNCYAPLQRVPLAGGQFSLSIATATAPTVPDGATAVLVMPVGTNNTSGQCLLWRDDGTDPTASVGNPAAAGQPFWYHVKRSATLSTINPNFKVIAASGATCTVNFNYYQ